MKKIVKIISFAMMLTIIFNIINIFNYTVSAATYDEMMSQAKGFISHGKTQAASSKVSIGDITSEFVPLGQLLTSIGAGVLIAVTTYMGIKYITSGPEAQAKLKQQLIGVIVSGVVIFGAYGIWKIVGQIAQTFEN